MSGITADETVGAMVVVVVVVVAGAAACRALVESDAQPARPIDTASIRARPRKSCMPTV